MPAKKKQVKATPPTAARAVAPKKVRIGKLLTKAEKLAACNATSRAAANEVQAMINTRAEESVVKRKQGGQPYPYTEELGKRIHDLLVQGLSVMKASKMPDMPDDVTMFKWIGDPSHPFSELYKRAKQLMVARFEEEIQAIADEPDVQEIVTEREAVVDGVIVKLKEVRRVDATEHRKLRIDARRWTLSHLMPKKHGRQPEAGIGEKNDQLEALFASLKSGPVAPSE
jgi:hypothetical protein